MFDNVTIKYFVDGSQAEASLNKLHNSIGKTQSGFSGISSAIGKTFSQLTSFGRNAEMFLWAITGLSVQKAVDNLKDFSSSFGLLNATIRMKMPESIAMVKNAMFEISNSTGEAVKQVNDSMNQLLSSGLTPSAMEGTKEWKKQMQDIIDIQKQVSQWAIGMWVTSNQLWESGVKFISSTGWDVKNPKDWKEAMSYMAATLDRWVGFMTEYTNQFAKFNLPATQLGWSKADTLSMFAEFTKNVSPNYAGLYTQQIARFAQRAVPEANSMKVQQKIAAKVAKEFWVNNEDYKIITSMPVSKFANFFVDEWWKQRGMLEMLNKINEVYSKLTSKTAQGMFLTEITAGNSRVAFALTAALNWIKGIDESQKYMTDMAERGQIAIDKYSIMNDTFAVRYNKFTNSINNTMTHSMDALSPAIWWMMSIMSVPFWGIWQSPADLADEFALAKKQIDLLPESMKWIKWPLNTIVDKIKEFTFWMSSPSGKEWFSNMASSAMNLARAFWSIAGAIWWIVSNPAFSALMKFVTANPNLAVWALFAKNLLWWAWWNLLWSVLWKSAWWAMATGFTSVLPWLMNPVTAWIVLAIVAWLKWYNMFSDYAAKKSALSSAQASYTETISAAIKSWDTEKIAKAKDIMFPWMNIWEEDKWLSGLQKSLFWTETNWWERTWYRALSRLPLMWEYFSKLILTGWSQWWKDIWDMQKTIAMSANPMSYNTLEWKVWKNNMPFVADAYSKMWGGAWEFWKAISNIWTVIPNAILNWMKWMVFSPNFVINIDKNWNATAISSAGNDTKWQYAPVWQLRLWFNS